METVGRIYHFDEPKDKESVKLMYMLKNKDLKDVIVETTGLKDDPELVEEIVESYNNAENDKKNQLSYIQVKSREETHGFLYNKRGI